MAIPRRLPDFLIVGACKCATTSLFDDLALHPDTFLTRPKEPYILGRAEGDAESAQRLYARYFADAPDGAVLGEATTLYTMMPVAPDLAGIARAAIGPDVRIVYIMREPVSRIVSHLAHDYLTGVLRSTDFDQHVATDDRYITITDYSWQIAPWIEAFGRESVRLVLYEDYAADPASVARSVAEFIGLDPARLPDRTDASNQRGSQRAWRSEAFRHFAHSTLYQMWLRHAVPDWLRTAARSVMSRSRRVPNIALSAETNALISKRLSHLPEALGKLGVDTSGWVSARAPSVGPAVQSRHLVDRIEEESIRL